MNALDDKELRDLARRYRDLRSTQDIAATLDAAISEIDQLRARVAELEADTSTEWAVRWPDAPPREQIERSRHPYDDGGEIYAREVFARYRSDGAELVSRTVRRSAWSLVAAGGAS